MTMSYSRKLFGDVGNFLQEYKMFLQDPRGCDRNVRYRNPHRISGLDEEAPMTFKLTFESAAPLALEAPDPVDVLSGFETGNDLSETQGSSLLVTRLQRHTLVPRH